MAVLLVVAGITILNVAAARGDNGRSLEGSARSFLHPLAPALSRHFRVQSSGARSSACGLLSHFREPVVLTSHLMEMLFERGRYRISSQASHARRVLAVVIRR
jgi:hypothetical protein